MDTKEILQKSISDHQKAIDEAKAELEKLEVTYSIGDRFEHKSEKYILTWTGEQGKATLVRLNDGNVWDKSCSVEFVDSITAEEFTQLVEDEIFERYYAHNP
jgi:hypothetical protein